MEHLLSETTQSQLDETLRTEWLGFNHYSDKPVPFADYPGVRGWDKNGLRTGNLSHVHTSQTSKTPKEAAFSATAFLQSWLYFGVLEGITGKCLDIASFVSKDVDGVMTLKSTNLLTILKTSKPIATFLQQRGQGGPRVWFDELAATIKDAESICVELQEFAYFPSLQYPTWTNLLESILPSIILMLEAVKGVAKLFDPGNPRLIFDYIHFPPGAHQRRLERLIALGWCPFTLANFIKTTNNSVISWIDVSKIKREPSRHTQCDRSQCRVYQIDEVIYKTRHVVDHCNCEFKSPPLNVIQFALNCGKIPAITAVDGVELRLDVVSFKPGKTGRYIAFSHVWADGIGSVSEQGLPICQIRRLSKIAARLTGQVQPCFWIDSLCVPEQQSLRKKAITLMAQTYSSAAVVVVLDRDIENISIHSPSEQLLLSIYTSGWMSRLWTYQEATLAKILFLQMKDGLYELDATQLPSPTLPLMIIWVELARLVGALRRQPHEKIPMIGHIHSTLRWRSTSKPDEETLAIAKMVGIETSALLQYDGEARKAAFWRLLKSIPKGIIHLGGAKLSLDGFRWAPLTLLHQPGVAGTNTMMSFMDGDAKCTEHGLVGDFETLILMSEWTTRMDVRVFVYEEVSTDSVFEIIGIDEFDGEFTFNAVLLAGRGWEAMRLSDARIGTAIFIKPSQSTEEFEYTGERMSRVVVRRITKGTTSDGVLTRKGHFDRIRLCLK